MALRLSDISMEKLSPMMRQYVETKQKNEDVLLFYRLGDFYEMFFDDAILVSRLLELTLTGRDCGLEERAPMCGIPYMAVDGYIKKLVQLGYKVAICEQLSDPAESKGLVERDIIRIVTPGTLIESSMLDESANNYLCCIYAEKEELSVCFADISTGEAALQSLKGKEKEEGVIALLSRYQPAEILFNDRFLDCKMIQDFLKHKLHASGNLRDSDCFSIEKNKDLVLKQFSCDNLEYLGVSEDSNAAKALAALFEYINDTQKMLVGRFVSLQLLGDGTCMTLDMAARQNLELLETLRTKEKKGSLFSVLDHTCTSMGRRKLRSWMEQPLLQPVAIIDRLDAVEQLIKNSLSLMELSEALHKVYDLERLMTRVMYQKATPRDIKSLSVTALQLPAIKEQLSVLSKSRLLQKLNQQIDTLEEISNLVENALVDEPPLTLKDGGVIRDGFRQELDEYRNAKQNGDTLLENLIQREREESGIKNMKLGYNHVFGYYYEVSRSYYDKVPAHYIRKQTLANSERFFTEELKQTENAILGAKDKALALENLIFNEIREYLAGKLRMVQSTAAAVAEVDVLCSFASVALQNQYVKPEIAIDGVIDIRDGRHPVVESLLEGEIFVPNDVYLNQSGRRLAMITGPNMSGKSTYMRQTALITLMAQMGSFVPASYAKISVVDRIFTRIGASDDLTAGESTFMVEMHEIADILKYATKNSLVILDEVGRGTSTSDGLSIARAVAEYMVKGKGLGCKTMFATHYHELLSLEEELEGVVNLSVAVQMQGENIRFLRKIVSGGIDNSYGIDVAKLAGLPKSVVARAKELLAVYGTEEKITKKSDDQQISFDALEEENVLRRLRKTHISELSDTECRMLLEELVQSLK